MNMKRQETIIHALNNLPNARTEQETNDLYQSIMDSLRVQQNRTNKPEVKQVYVIHDNMYFDKATAELFEDGKDHVSTHYIVVQPFETVSEGTVHHYLYSNLKNAMEELDQ